MVRDESSAALSSLRTASDNSSGAHPARSRPCRRASPIAPTPMMATVGCAVMQKSYDRVEITASMGANHLQHRVDRLRGEAALDDHVRMTLRGLDELQIHRAHRVKYWVMTEATLGLFRRCPLQTAGEADIGIGVDEDLEVELSPQTRLGETRIPSTTITGAGRIVSPRQIEGGWRSRRQASLSRVRIAVTRDAPPGAPSPTAGVVVIDL